MLPVLDGAWRMCRHVRRLSGGGGERRRGRRIHKQPSQFRSLPYDVLMGLVKTVFFAIVIVIVGAQQGLQTTGGATGVGTLDDQLGGYLDSDHLYTELLPGLRDVRRQDGVPVITALQLSYRISGRSILRRLDLQRGEGRDAGGHGHVRRGQEHAAQVHRRAPEADGRTDADRWHRYRADA